MSVLSTRCRAYNHQCHFSICKDRNSGFSHPGVGKLGFEEVWAKYRIQGLGFLAWLEGPRMLVLWDLSMLNRLLHMSCSLNS